MKKLKYVALGCAAAGLVVFGYWLGGVEFVRGPVLGGVFLQSCVAGLLVPGVFAAAVEE